MSSEILCSNIRKTASDKYDTMYSTRTIRMFAMFIEEFLRMQHLMIQMKMSAGIRARKRPA
jgi:hypothetical protein